MEVNEHVIASRRDVGAAFESHRRVAVRVDGDDVVVQALRLTEVFSVVDKMAEERCHAAVGSVGIAFRMPLHADDGFPFVALHGLDDAIGRACRHVQVRSCLADSLVVERVDGQFFAQQTAQR